MYEIWNFVSNTLNLCDTLLRNIYKLNTLINKLIKLINI